MKISPNKDGEDHASGELEKVDAVMRHKPVSDWDNTGLFNMRAKNRKGAEAPFLSFEKGVIYISRAVMSYFFIFSTSVVRRMPSMSAARATTPSCISNA